MAVSVPRVHASEMAGSLPILCETGTREYHPVKNQFSVYHGFCFRRIF